MASELDDLKKIDTHSRGFLFYFLILLAVVFVTFLVIYIATGFEDGLDALSLGFMASLAVLSLVFAAAAWRVGTQRLVVSNDGLEVSTWKGTESIRWDDVGEVSDTAEALGFRLQSRNSRQSLRVPYAFKKFSLIFGYAVDCAIRNSLKEHMSRLSGFELPFEARNSDFVVMPLVGAAAVVFAIYQNGFDPVAFGTVTASMVLLLWWVLHGKQRYIRIDEVSIEMVTLKGHRRISYSEIADVRMGLRGFMAHQGGVAKVLRVLLHTGEVVLVDVNEYAWMPIYLHICRRIGKW